MLLLKVTIPSKKRQRSLRRWFEDDVFELHTQNLRVRHEIPIVDGFNQLLRHLYYLLFTGWTQGGGGGGGEEVRLSEITWKLNMSLLVLRLDFLETSDVPNDVITRAMLPLVMMTVTFEVALDETHHGAHRPYETRHQEDVGTDTRSSHGLTQKHTREVVLHVSELLWPPTKIIADIWTQRLHSCAYITLETHKLHAHTHTLNMQLWSQNKTASESSTPACNGVFMNPQTSGRQADGYKQTV